MCIPTTTVMIGSSWAVLCMCGIESHFIKSEMLKRSNHMNFIVCSVHTIDYHLNEFHSFVLCCRCHIRSFLWKKLLDLILFLLLYIVLRKDLPIFCKGFHSVFYVVTIPTNNLPWGNCAYFASLAIFGLDFWISDWLSFCLRFFFGKVRFIRYLNPNSLALGA